VLFAGFFAPYDPSEQERQSPSRPPTRIHWIGIDGRLHWRPFVYGPPKPAEGSSPLAESTPTSFPIEFLPQGVHYSVLGAFTWNRHLFGVAEPARLYVAGTDSYGRDVFSRLLYGGRISLLAGLLATTISLMIALVLGMVAGFYGGWPDLVVMRGVELFLALPWLYLLLALRASLPLHTDPRWSFLLLIGVIGLVGWTRPARLIRGVVLSLRERHYILAARCFGASDLYLLRRHLLPETRSVVLTQAALLIPQYVLAEVTLSFLGLGVAEPVPSWGSMLASLQQYHVLVSDWWMFSPGVVMVFIFLSFGGLANALQHRTAQAGS
jgi:peptide/nickel transport system permease protein